MRAAAVPLILVVLLAGCGGGGGGSPRSALEAYQKALGAGDAKEVCSRLSKDAVATVAKQGKSKDATCATVLGAYLKAAGKANLKAIRDAKITSLKRNGDKATARVTGNPSPIPLVKEDGKWRIASQ